MNYQHPERRELLAAEYVMGTLVGRARIRFERLLSHNRLLRLEVAQWEARLHQLNFVAPVQPPRRVWRKIRKDINTEASGGRAAQQRVRWWKSYAALASVMLVLSAVALRLPRELAIEHSDFVSVVNAENSQPAWIVRFDTGSRSISIETLRTMQATKDRSFELWLLQANGTPLSLGLLPNSGKRRRVIPESDFSVNNGLAVSIEPMGGSTTGAPTGPVVYQSSIFMVL